MKNFILPVAIVLTILSCYLMINAKQTVEKAQKTLELERYQRITAEEKLQTAELQASRMKASLAKSESKMARIQSILSTDKTAQLDLETQLEKIEKEKESLQKKINELEGLVAAGSNETMGQP